MTSSVNLRHVTSRYFSGLSDDCDIFLLRLFQLIESDSQCGCWNVSRSVRITAMRQAHRSGQTESNGDMC